MGGSFASPVSFSGVFSDSEFSPTVSFLRQGVFSDFNTVVKESVCNSVVLPRAPL